MRRPFVRELRAGRDHRVAWDGLDERGRPVPSGIYFTHQETPDGARTWKRVLLR